MKSSLSKIDKNLVDIVTAPVKTIPDVLQVMEAIDKTLDHPDGLKWFNQLYWLVTQRIQRDCEERRWKSGDWFVHLDVEFAKLYFEAIAKWLHDPETAPRAWVPLLESRFRQGISPVQFALAGMNAHINRDLPIAVIRASRNTGSELLPGTPQQEDFLRVNQVLDDVETKAMQEMARGWVKRVSKLLDPLDRKAAIFVINKARAAAWTHAEKFWEFGSLDTPAAKDFLHHLDHLAERIGRTLLYPELEKIPKKKGK